MLWQPPVTSSLQPDSSVAARPVSTGVRVPYPSSRSENPVADVVATVEPSVVSIDTTIVQKDTSDSDLPDLLFPKHGNSFKLPSHLEAHGSGSGVVIRSDGYVMTNYHVVKSASDIKVTLADGRVYSGRVVGHDDYTDVALLKIDTNGLKVARLGSSKNVRTGDWAIAIGTPLGLRHTVTMGIVSAIGRSLADLNNNIDLIQTDAAINPGNSGGPLVNIDGEVIGLNMAIRTDAQNIGFSIPIDIARDAASAILDKRPLLHPYLGISMVDFDPELASRVSAAGNQEGVLISKVSEHSPAAASGLTEGDLIKRVENVPVRTGGDVQKIVRQHRVGSRLFLEVVHGGKDKRVEVTLSAYPERTS
jgi:S1-C subfamily serine protease